MIILTHLLHSIEPHWIQPLTDLGWLSKKSMQNGMLWCLKQKDNLLLWQNFLTLRVYMFWISGVCDTFNWHDYRPHSELIEGYVFTDICLFNLGVVTPNASWDRSHGHRWQVVWLWGWTSPPLRQDHLPPRKGRSMTSPPAQDHHLPPPPTSGHYVQAGNMHPTGMYSSLT